MDSSYCYSLLKSPALVAYPIPHSLSSVIEGHASKAYKVMKSRNGTFHRIQFLRSQNRCLWIHDRRRYTACRPKTDWVGWWPNPLISNNEMTPPHTGVLDVRSGNKPRYHRWVITSPRVWLLLMPASFFLCLYYIYRNLLCVWKYFVFVLSIIRGLLPGQYRNKCFTMWLIFVGLSNN